MYLLVHNLALVHHLHLHWHHIILLHLLLLLLLQMLLIDHLEQGRTDLRLRVIG